MKRSRHSTRRWRSLPVSPNHFPSRVKLTPGRRTFKSSRYGSFQNLLCVRIHFTICSGSRIARLDSNENCDRRSTSGSRQGAGGTIRGHANRVVGHAVQEKSHEIGANLRFGKTSDFVACKRSEHSCQSVVRADAGRQRQQV